MSWPQLQGGFVPSWQTTVVFESCGTTTVVFSGGGVLLLLMQPAINGTIKSMLARTFIVSFLGATAMAPFQGIPVK